MKNRGKGRSVGQSVLSALLVLAIGAPAAWFGAKSLVGIHIESKTGRPAEKVVACWYCHGEVAPAPRRDVADSSAYISPAGLAVTSGGERLLVVGETGDVLLVVDPATGSVVRRVDLPGAPHDVATSADGSTVAVALRDADRVVLLDGETFEVRGELPAGREPLGVRFVPSTGQILVANGGSRDVMALTADGGQVRRWGAGTEPYAVAVSGDSQVAAVANRRALLRPEPLLPATELTLVDLVGGRVDDRRLLMSSHLVEGVALSSDGSFALVPALRVRNYLPTTQVARGALMTASLVFVETAPGGRTVYFPLDETNAYYADPSDVVLTPDDRLAFVSHGGANAVSVVDVGALKNRVESSSAQELEALAEDLGAFAEYVVARIPTRDNPRALAVSPDGSQVFVAERLSDSVAVIDTERLEIVQRITLGDAEPDATRRGEIVFHDASGTFQGQFSCRSCHPDGHTDGLNWDFEIDGIGLHRLETRSLLGVRGTAPFKWNGKNPDLATQCGPRFARVLTRAEPFAEEDLADLVTYIQSLPLPAPRPVDPQLEDAVERGRELFFRTTTNSGVEIPLGDRCDTCHRPPLYTHRLKTDVHSGGSFDTPHLLGVADSAPYLHDGRAASLEEIWTVFNPDDTHGVTNDLTKVQLNELILFLRSL